jgi:hypothetical protein
MARNEQWNTRLPDDISEQLHEYCEDRGISKSETLRRAAESFAEDLSEPPEPPAEEPGQSDARLVADGGAITRPILSSILTGAFLYPVAVMTLWLTGYVGPIPFLGAIGGSLVAAVIVVAVLSTDLPEEADRRIMDATDDRLRTLRGGT